MNKYCLYYYPPKSDPTLGDSLIVYFGNNLPTRKIEKSDVVDKLYNGDALIGYIIHNFSNYCKIRMSGPIYLPNDQIVDIVNDVLINAGLKEIEYYDHSGFLVGEIKSKKALKKSFLYEIDAKDKYIVESTFDLPEGKKVVVATNGTYLMPGMVIAPYKIETGEESDGRLCSNQDLNIEPHDEFFPIIVEDEATNGEDFFKVERRESDA